MKKLCKIFSVILAISMVLSMFCLGTASAETEETNILLNNTSATITPIQVAIDGLDWTKTSFSYEGMEISDAYYISGNAATLTDSDYSNVAPINSETETIPTAGEIATRRMAVKIDLGGYYNASSIKVDTQNGSWAAARLVYSYNVYGAAKYDEATILNDENLIGSFIVDGNNYWSNDPRTTNIEGANVRYVVIVFNLLGSDPGVKDNTIMTDLTDVPVVPATSYVYSDVGGKNAGYAGHIGKIFLSEIEVFGSAVPQSNVLLNNAKATVTPIQVATEGLDWTKTSFSYEGMEISDAYYVSGNAATLTDSDYTNAAPINSESASVPTATQIATRRLALKVDLGGYYNTSSVKVDTQNGTWAAARLVYSYNVYGAAKYDEATILNDENLIGSFIIDGNNHWSNDPRTTNIDGANVRYLVIVFNLAGSDPGLLDNTIMTDLTDVPVVPSTSGYYKDVNGNNSGYASHAGKIFLSEIEVLGSAVPQSNVLLNNTSATIIPVQVATEGLDWTKTSFSYEGMNISDAYYTTGNAAATLTDSDYTNVAPINSASAGVPTAAQIATRRMAVKIDLGGYYNASSVKVDTQHGSWAAARRIFSYNVYGAANYDAATILNDENLIGSYIVNGNDYYLDSEREATIDGEDVRYLVIVFNLVGSDPGLLENTIMTDLTDVSVVPATSYLYKDLNGSNQGYSDYVGMVFLSEIEVFGARNTEHKDEVMAGDVTGDKEIDIRDLVCLKKYYAVENVEVVIENIDVNKDGAKNTDDIIALRRVLLNK